MSELVKECLNEGETGLTYLHKLYQFPISVHCSGGLIHHAIAQVKHK